MAPCATRSNLNGRNARRTSRAAGANVPPLVRRETRERLKSGEKDKHAPSARYFGASSLPAADGAAQPGSRVSPLPVCGCPRHAEGVGHLFNGQPGEEVELNDLGGRRVFLRQARQSFV